MGLRLPRQLSSRLILSSAVQLLLVGSALGLLGYSTGRREGLEQLAQERRATRMNDLSLALSTRLEAPQQINRANMLAIRQGLVRLDDFDGLASRFWRQMQLYPVGYINYGSAQGSFIGVERLDNGQFRLNEDSDIPLGRGRLGVYRMGPSGQRGPLVEVVPGMDTFHNEAWYADTVKANRASWSSIYQWEDKPEVLAISYNEPVRAADGRLLGVIGVDFVLTQLSSWLQQLWRSTPGMALIVEPNGLVVASSRPALSSVPGRKGLPRARIDQLNDPLTRAMAARYFVPSGSDLRIHRAALQQPQQALLRSGDRNYALQASDWGRPEGLHWLLITAIGQDPALIRSQNHTVIMALLGLAALAVAIGLNRQLIGWLLAPMNLLKLRAIACAQDPSTAFKAVLPPNSASELAATAAAIGTLVQQLQQAQAQLAEASARERHKDAAALQLLKLKLRSSLEAAGVAHEIKAPLSQILLSCRLLLDASAGSAALAAEASDEIRAIAAAAEQMLTTIETMRTLLRNVQTAQQPLDLSAVISSALLYMKPALGKARVSTTREGLEQVCVVMGDSAQLQIAVVNLLRNSLEALQQVQPPRRLAVRLRMAGGLAVLTVEDSGPGFEPGFEPLEVLESTRPQGSGLGLFVVQTTLEHHRGSITLGRSSLGGASVTLKLPLAPTGSDLPTTG